MAATQFVHLSIARSLFFGIPTMFQHTAAYVGLFTADPGYIGDKTNEVSGGSYARVQPTWTFQGADSQTASDISFPIATGSWGTVTHVALLDASTSGNMLAYEPLPTPITVESGREVALDGMKAKLVLINDGISIEETKVSYPYRRTRYIDSVLHGLDLDAQPGSWVGLARGVFLAATDGVGVELNEEVDQGYAPEYVRGEVAWEITSTDPVTITNTNTMEWTVLSGNTDLGWKWAARTVVLYQDPAPLLFQNQAPASIAWVQWRTVQSTATVTAGDVLRLPAGSMTVTF